MVNVNWLQFNCLLGRALVDLLILDIKLNKIDVLGHIRLVGQVQQEEQRLLPVAHPVGPQRELVAGVAGRRATFFQRLGRVGIKAALQQGRTGELAVEESILHFTAAC